MKKLALFAFTLLSAWAMTAKTITGPVDYVSPLVGTQSKHALIYRKYLPCHCAALGNELLGSADW